MSPDGSSARLADSLAEIEQKLAAVEDPDEVLRSITQLALDSVPGAEHAGVTRGSAVGFASMAETSDLVKAVDEIQYELASGPCVDAMVRATVFNAPDLRTDQRWPEFGRRAFEETGVVSMLSFRLFLEDDLETIAGLNIYSARASAFDERSERTGLLLATAAAFAVAGAVARDRATNLQRALETSREIGIAIGVLMSGLKVTRAQGFDLLRVASQSMHRKLADVASEVAETGALPELPLHLRANLALRPPAG